MSQLDQAKAELARRARIAAAQAELKSRQPGALDYVEQAGAGSQQGIARMAGFPVDAVTSAINGVGNLTGLFGPIENPVGGSQWIDEKSGMTSLRQNVPEPNTPGLRAARRVGEEVGASAVAFPLAMASPVARAAPGSAALVEGASALGSGIGSAIAQEVAPGSVTADIVASLGGGLAGGKIASTSLDLNGTAATVRKGVDEQKMVADDAYARVRADQTPIPQSTADDLSNRLNARMAKERLNPRLHPSSNNVVDAITEDASSGRLSRMIDLEESRRLTESTVPFSAADADKRLAAIAKNEITDYIDNLGGESADNLKIGRDAHRRGAAAESIIEARRGAELGAASTGSGGNEINATRQKLKNILLSPRKSRSFKASELDAIEQVVRGDMPTNSLRRFSRFAPSSGGLSSLLGIGGALAAPGVATPIMIATELAKAGGEKLTRAGIEAVIQSLAPDRVLNAGQQGIEPIIRALLAARTTASATQENRGTKQ